MTETDDNTMRIIKYPILPLHLHDGMGDFDVDEKVTTVAINHITCVTRPRVKRSGIDGMVYGLFTVHTADRLCFTVNFQAVSEVYADELDKGIRSAHAYLLGLLNGHDDKFVLIRRGVLGV